MTRDAHPDLDALAAHAAGALEGEEARAVAAHVAECRHCRLEVLRLERFAAVDADAELAAEADWDRVGGRLVRPDHRVIDAADRFRRVKRLLWLAPAAAAAVLLFSVLPLGEEVVRDLAVPGDVMRGDHGADPLLDPEFPVGDVPVAPERFLWAQRGAFDAYRLEISTPELDVVLVRDDLAGAFYDLPDSLATLFVPGETYLWTVVGRRGVEDVAVSETAWFRILAAD